jgi:FRG domain-containing protein
MHFKEQHRVFDLREFLSVISPYGDPLWVYRGQPNQSWPLRPKAGRLQFYDRVSELNRQKYNATNPKTITESLDLRRFAIWKAQAVACSDSLPESDFECLAYAQHYGLATRLLDWSSNPLVGLYFAAESRDNGHKKLNGVVFAYQNFKYLDPRKETFDSIQRVVLYKPRPFDRRLLMQDAVFSYHPEPNVSLVPKLPPQDFPRQSPGGGSDLIKIVVPSTSKDRILRELSGIGISRKTLFPDLEGLSMFLNWQTQHGVKGRRRQTKFLRSIKPSRPPLLKH